MLLQLLTSTRGPLGGLGTHRVRDLVITLDNYTLDSRGGVLDCSIPQFFQGPLTAKTPAFLPHPHRHYVCSVSMEAHV